MLLLADFVYGPVAGDRSHSMNMNPLGPLEGLCLSGRIDPQYPLLIVKGNIKGQRRENVYLETVWKELRELVGH